ncbi:MAG: acetylxylan esterase [Cytophagales bacterium]|nr:acetylxylan esterase [Cytophagales bacterium]
MKSYIIPFILIVSTNCLGQGFTPNYDESKVPVYELPDLLTARDSTEVTTKKKWEKTRRQEILSDFETYMFGKIPDGNVQVEIKTIKESDAFGGKAFMKEVKMTFSGNGKFISMDVLMYLPRSQSNVPVFLGLNFYGNHTICVDPNITVPTSWSRNNEQFGITGNVPTGVSRGVRKSRWAVEKILDRGYGLATIYYGDIDPDKNDFSDGIHALFYDAGQSQPEKDEWGSIAAWAWGLSRAMDYFEKDRLIDEKKVVLMGHSRLGKTSLWAGAIDQRFAIVISNNSGCGGAALSRRKYGETVWRINNSFPHWFNDHFNDYSNNEDALPVDQHMLIALIAPRPVYVASAENDRWADPKGEFLAAYNAGAVYELFGLEGLPSYEMPKANQPIHKTIGYHIRAGGHDVTDYDWGAWMDFADMHFRP